MIAFLIGGSLSLMVALAMIYPALLSPWNYESPAKIYSMTNPSQEISPEPARSLYRGDIARSGTARWRGRWPIEFFSRTLFESLNFDIHGATKSEAVVDESGIYIGSDSGFFYALTHAGQVRWKYKISQSFQGIHASAATTQSYVIFAGYNGRVYVLNKHTGELLWSRQVAHSIGASPTIWKDKIIVPCEHTRPKDGYVVALNMNNGIVNWQSEFVGDQVHSSLSIHEGSEIGVVGTNAAEVLGLSLDTGEIRWRVKTNEKVRATAVITRTMAWIPSNGGELLAIVPESGEVRHRISLNSPSQSSPSVTPTGEIILSTFRGIEKFDADGNRLWAQDFNLDTNYSSALYLKNRRGDRIVARCGETAICILDAKDGRMIQKLLTKFPFHSSPTIFKNHILLPLRKRELVSLELAY